MFLENNYKVVYLNNWKIKIKDYKVWLWFVSNFITNKTKVWK